MTVTKTMGVTGEARRLSKHTPLEAPYTWAELGFGLTGTFSGKPAHPSRAQTAALSFVLPQYFLRMLIISLYRNY